MTGTVIAAGFVTGNLFNADLVVFFSAFFLFSLTFLKNKND
jgi:hypothetical protein